MQPGQGTQLSVTFSGKAYTLGPFSCVSFCGPLLTANNSGVPLRSCRSPGTFLHPSLLVSVLLATFADLCTKTRGPWWRPSQQRCCVCRKVTSSGSPLDSSSRVPRPAQKTMRKGSQEWTRVCTRPPSSQAVLALFGACRETEAQPRRPREQAQSAPEIAPRALGPVSPRSCPLARPGAQRGPQEYSRVNLAWNWLSFSSRGRNFSMGGRMVILKRGRR